MFKLLKVTKEHVSKAYNKRARAKECGENYSMSRECPIALAGMEEFGIVRDFDTNTGSYGYVAAIGRCLTAVFYDSKFFDEEAVIKVYKLPREAEEIMKHYDGHRSVEEIVRLNDLPKTYVLEDEEEDIKEEYIQQNTHPRGPNCLKTIIEVLDNDEGVDS